MANTYLSHAIASTMLELEKAKRKGEKKEIITRLKTALTHLEKCETMNKAKQ